MSNPNLSSTLTTSPPLNCPSLMGPNLDVVVAESTVYGHDILTTFIDGQFVGVYIEKDGKKIFSHLNDVETVLETRKDS
jgi:hypothetical protein